VIKFKLKFSDEKYRLCINRDLFENEMVEPNKYFDSSAYVYRNGTKVFSCSIPIPLEADLTEEGMVPPLEGRFTVEFYAFPKKLELNESQLVDNLFLGKRIFVIEKEVRCRGE
jgi:hypothetical protein